MTALRSIRGGAVSVAVLLASVLAAGAADEPEGEWIAGDLHVHTTYSHDAWDPLSDEDSAPWTLGHSVTNQFLIAASRGLDYLAITDHNDTRSIADDGFGAFGVLGVRGYEASLSGHAQILGVPSCVHPSGPVQADRACNDFPDRNQAATINELADTVRALGGVFQINHPADGTVDWPNDPDWRYGFDVVPDAVEVWNIQSVWQPPAPASSSIDDAIRFWEGFLDLGYHVAATGGSDNHWVSTTAVQGVGQPTTWIYVTERTEAGILEGIRRGRTTISWQPPAYGGARLFLEADTDGDGVYDAMVGDVVPSGASFRVRSELAPPGSWLRVRSSDGTISEGPVVADGVEADVPEGARWIWAELVLADRELLPGPVVDACEGAIGGSSTYCRNRLVRLAMTSALFVEAAP